MADKKYIHKTVALPKELGESLEVMRLELEKRLGFRPSLSETIAYLLADWRANNQPV